MALLLTLSGCGKKDPSGIAAPAPVSAPAQSAAPEAGRQVGDRYEDTLMLDAPMVIRYERIRSDTVGFEMDYDYETFVRRSEGSRERFVLSWDDQADPEYYLEVTRSPEDAETIADAICGELSLEYEINREWASLDSAGPFIRVVASQLKNGGGPSEHMQTVYIVPADDGCRIAAAHYGIESSDLYGAMFRRMMQTFVPVTAAPPADPDRQDGKRFETVIILEGMEETVAYEHAVNETAGIEMDYDFESFARYSAPDRERFLSVWDDPADPWNYLDVTFSPESAEAAAASVREELSSAYDLLEESRTLERAGECLYIEASRRKGTDQMAERLQAVYIIPAPDGCRVARAHYHITAAEGFGRRFAYMLNTLAVIERNGDRTLSDEQALSAIRNYCCANNPDLESSVNAGEYPIYWDISSSDEHEIVVLFRSYTGALIHYHIDRITGDAYATEFVPGITPEEEPTEESLNVWEYAG